MALMSCLFGFCALVGVMRICWSDCLCLDVCVVKWRNLRKRADPERDYCLFGCHKAPVICDAREDPRVLWTQSHNSCYTSTNKKDEDLFSGYGVAWEHTLVS